MKGYLILMAVFVLVSGLATSCSPGLQTFDKYDISFKVSKELKLEEYTFDFENQTFRRGTAGYKQGAVLSSEKNFILLWVTPIPRLTREEVRRSILTTPNIFESASGAFRAEITGDLVTQEIAGFEVIFAQMQFTEPGWKAPGITAVWYCPASQRTMQLILINRSAEREMNRFIRSLSCDISGTGTVKFIDLEGGFYGIVGDDNKQYDPMNLDQTYQKDGLRVRFQAKIHQDIASIHMWGTIIELTKIEKLK